MTAHATEIANGLTPDQRALILKRGRSFSTVEAMSLPLADLVTRSGGFNNWRRTPFGLEVERICRADQDRK